MPLSDQEMELFTLIKDAIPVTLKKENEDKAKKEYEEYKLNKNFKKIEELNPLTVYFIISELKGNDQAEFIKENIEYIKKNDENIFIYNMMAPHSLAYYLSYNSFKEISVLDKKIFSKVLKGNVENIIANFSNEEIISFFKEFSEEIKENMKEYSFVNFYLYAKQVILNNFRRFPDYRVENFGEIYYKSKEEMAKLTDIIINDYGGKISCLNDSAFLRFFSSVFELNGRSVNLNAFLQDNKEKLNNIYKTINSSKIFESFEDAGVSNHKIILENFGETIFNRGDLKEYFASINGDLLFEYYRKDKNYFKDLEVEDWLKIPFIDNDLKAILDDYVDFCDFKKLFNGNRSYNKDGIVYLESNYRKNIEDENLLDVSEIISIYCNEYIKNLEIIKRKLLRKEILKSSKVYKQHFEFFVNYLRKNNNIVEINEGNIRELERYFFLIIKGLSLVEVKSIDGINKIALFNRVGSYYGIDESEFSLEQIQRFNVKEHKLLFSIGVENGNSDFFIKNYKTLTLKLMLLVGYERARYILSLDKNITTLEHLVGNVNVKNIKLDVNNHPVINKKIINLLFKDLHHNRIEIMLKDKTSELYKYFPRIFNEWDLVELNYKSKNLSTIIEYLKSDDVCVGSKYYRLKGLFRYIGCDKGIVNDTLELHDEMIKRVGSTIPYIKGECGAYTYEVLKLKDMEGLTVGNKTDCCFTVKGNAYSSLKHALTNKNGRILAIKKNGELVAHSWLWRNGNVLCLDNIEVSKSIEEVDFLDVYLKFSEEIIEKSHLYESEDTCLKNITVGRTYFDKKVIGLEKYKKIVLKNNDNLLEKNVVVVDKLPSVGTCNIYSDAKDKQVLLKGNGDFKYYDVDVSYVDERERVLNYSSYSQGDKEIVTQIVNGLRYIKFEQESNVENFKLIDLDDYENVWCNDDWYIIIDYKGNVERFALMYDERAKNEIKSILNEFKKVVKR